MVFGDISIKLLSQPLLTCFPLFVMERPLPTVVHSLARRSAAAEAAGWSLMKFQEVKKEFDGDTFDGVRSGMEGS